MNDENNTRNGFSSLNYTKKGITLVLTLFVEKSYFTFQLTFDLKLCPLAPPPSKIFDTARMLLWLISSPTLKNMDYKQESWFKCKVLGKLGLFYQFLRPMAAILDKWTFMIQILIDFFLVIDYIQ